MAEDRVRALVQAGDLAGLQALDRRLLGQPPLPEQLTPLLLAAEAGHLHVVQVRYGVVAAEWLT